MTFFFFFEYRNGAWLATSPRHKYIPHSAKLTSHVKSFFFFFLNCSASQRKTSRMYSAFVLRRLTSACVSQVMHNTCNCPRATAQKSQTCGCALLGHIEGITLKKGEVKKKKKKPKKESSVSEAERCTEKSQLLIHHIFIPNYMYISLSHL